MDHKYGNRKRKETGKISEMELGEERRKIPKKDRKGARK